MSEKAQREPSDDPRCPVCLQQIVDEDLAIRLHGDLLHLGCWDGPANGQQPRDRAAVKCAVCSRGIRRFADLLMHGSRPMHVECFQTTRTNRPCRDARA